MSLRETFDALFVLGHLALGFGSSFFDRIGALAIGVPARVAALVRGGTRLRSRAKLRLQSLEQVLACGPDFPATFEDITHVGRPTYLPPAPGPPARAFGTPPQYLRAWLP